MSWEITVDHICDGDDNGVTGPRGCGKDEARPHAFRMYDDDGELYYEGVSSEEDFDPLDDFGLPNAGCTDIHYKNKDGVWEPM